jgi:chromosome segregation ATPase
LPSAGSRGHSDRVVTIESGYDDSRKTVVGGLIPGQVYTKGNLKVSLERKRVDPGKFRGVKSKEEVVAVLSEVNQTDLEKHMELKTMELIEEVNLEKSRLNEEETTLIMKLKGIEENQGDFASDEQDLKRICERAVGSLEDTKRHVQMVKEEENEERIKLIDEIKKLEDELEGVDRELDDAENEYEEVTLTIKKSKVSYTFSKVVDYSR